MSLLRRAVRTVQVLASVRRERRVPYLPIAALHEIRDRRVRAIVAHAYDTVPYYRETLDQLGLTPADFHTADDLATLPLLAKTDIAADPERFRSTAIDPADSLVLTTSGTRGPNLSVRYDAEALRLNLACAGRETAAIARATGLSLLGLRVASFRRSGGVPESIQQFYRSQAFLPTRSLPLDPYAPLDENVARLNRFRPHVIAGAGSFVGTLFRLHLEGRMRLVLPRAVVFGGDPFPEGVRAHLERDCGVPVFSCYGATEVPRIGFSCERRRGLHLHADLSHVRPLDPHAGGGSDAPGELVVSNLTNRATVLLNYRQGDWGTLSDRACPCGRTLPLLDGTIGRVDEAIVLSNGRFVTRYHLDLVLGARTDLLEYQLVQSAGDSLVVKVIPTGGADLATIAQELRQGFASLVGDGVRIEVERVEQIPALPSGKVVRIVARPGA